MVTVKIDLNEAGIERRLNSNDFGLFVAKEWKRLIDPFTPRKTGALMEQADVSPWAITYDRQYSHYMYEGEIYVDPVYKVSGWFSEKRGWYSRKDVRKVPSGRRFNYGKINPFATDHWDQKAAQAGQLEPLAQTITTALNKRLY